MRELTGQKLKEIGLLKHYRVIRRWACKKTGLTDADLELLIYFDCLNKFTRKDFEDGILIYSWDNRRWNRLLKEGWAGSAFLMHLVKVTSFRMIALYASVHFARILWSMRWTCPRMASLLGAGFLVLHSIMKERHCARCSSM